MVQMAAERASVRAERKARFPSSAWLTVPALGFIVLVFAGPVISILSRSVTTPPSGLHYYEAFLGEPAYLKVLANTVRLSGMVTIFCLVLGLPFAYAMSIVRPRARRVLTLMLLVPLWTSWLVGAYSWLVILDRQGLVNSVLQRVGLVDEPLPLVHNGFGVTVGMVQILLPYMVLPLYAVIRNLPSGLLPAARSLGASPFHAFRTIWVPLMLPGIGAGCLLVFVVSLGYYITPAILGGPQDTVLSKLIAEQIGSLLNWGLGSAMAAGLLLVTLALMFVAARLSRVDRTGGAS